VSQPDTHPDTGAALCIFRYVRVRRRSGGELGEFFNAEPGGQRLTCPVTHFEIYGERPAELAAFYRALFGWKLEQAPGIDYWRIETGETSGVILSGGLTYRPVSAPHSWMNYVTVASLDDIVDLAQSMGGALIRAKAAVPKTGWHAVLADPEGNVFAVFEADRTAFPAG
jgi:predicted enzyme related to lactoylglutathione lyase